MCLRAPRSLCIRPTHAAGPASSSSWASWISAVRRAVACQAVSASTGAVVAVRPASQRRKAASSWK